MSTTTLDVELNLAAIKKENEEKLRLASEKLETLKKQLEDSQKIVREAPEQIGQLKKKFIEAQGKTADLERKFNKIDEEDEDPVYYAGEKKKVDDAKKIEQTIDEELKALNQKYEQAKQDEIKLKKEVDDQQIQIQDLKRVLVQDSNFQNESFRSLPTKSFQGSQGTGNTNNINNLVEQKKTEAFDHIKSLCNSQKPKYIYNDEKKEVALTGKGGVITFTKNGATTDSDKDEDMYAMARDMFNAFIKNENDLKTVDFKPSGPKEAILKQAIAELKAAKLKEFQEARIISTQDTSRLTQRNPTTSQSVVGRVENDQRERSTSRFTRS